MAHDETSANRLSAFDSKAEVWKEHRSPSRGGLRVELSLHYLAQHLNLPADKSTALDAGGGRSQYAYA